MKKIWIIVSLATIFGTCYEIVIAQETDNKMSFFVTSVNLAGAAKKGEDGVGGIPEHKTGEPATCNDWTGGKGRARVGHFDSQHGESGTIWNSAHYSLGCSQEDIEKNASIGLFYCFAAD